MILLDTHIWIWWVMNSPKLTASFRALLSAASPNTIGVSVVSCWEGAKLVQVKKLVLSMPTGEWISQALCYPGVKILPLTPEIAIHSTELPGLFHRDPFDQILVATARIEDIPMMTHDSKILAYPFVKLQSPLSY